MQFKKDCKFWVGYKPCQKQKSGEVSTCDNCSLYQGVVRNYLIIEAGGLGSALRMSVVSSEIRRNNPNSLIQWLTADKNVELAKNIPSIDKAYAISWENMLILSNQCFDLIINFESDKTLLAFAGACNSPVKGFIGGGFGQLICSDTSSHEFLKLQTDDCFRRRENKKSMQQIWLELVGYKWFDQKYDLVSLPQDDTWALNFFKEQGVSFDDKKVIGLNIGSSAKHSAKRWSPLKFYQLVKMCELVHDDWMFVILAGHEDEDAYLTIQDLNNRSKLSNLIFTGYRNTISQFISLVSNIPIVISADTFGLHASLSLSEKVISLWGPQPANEVHSYGKESKISVSLDCAPCFAGVSNNCLHQNKLECMEKISIKLVYEALKKELS